MTGRCEGIGIDKSADLGIVISALEIVEPRLGFVVLATRAKMHRKKDSIPHLNYTVFYGSPQEKTGLHISVKSSLS